MLIVYDEETYGQVSDTKNVERCGLIYILTAIEGCLFKNKGVLNIKGAGCTSPSLPLECLSKATPSLTCTSVILKNSYLVSRCQLHQFQSPITKTRYYYREYN